MEIVSEDPRLKDPIQRYEPKGISKGCILVISDSRLLNHMHGVVLSAEGYVVVTGITLTDCLTIVHRQRTTQINLVLIASKVHGWHGRHGEEKPKKEGLISPDENWENGNIATLVDQIAKKQGKKPHVLIAYDLIHSPWYKTTASGLRELGLALNEDYHTYFASDPYSAIEHYEEAIGLRPHHHHKKN
jgi:hypothetical protein